MKELKRFAALIVIFSLAFSLMTPAAFATESVEDTDSQSRNRIQCHYVIHEDYTGELTTEFQLTEASMDAYMQKLNEEKIVVGVVHTPLASLRKNYVNAIKSTGGVAQVLPLVTTEEEAKSVLSGIDALVLTGGDDIDPALYGAEPSHRLEKVNPERDLSDILMLKEAMAQKMPVLATCRGMQLLNIIQGGTLYQDIRSEYETDIVHRNLSDWDGAWHDISIAEGSQVARILGATEYMVNSWHHQAIKDVGEGLVVTATSPDGLVEAIEMPENENIIGIQFHPERTVGPDEIGPLQLEFYYDMLEKAKNFRYNREMQSFSVVEGEDGEKYFTKTTSNSVTSTDTIPAMFQVFDENRVIKCNLNVNDHRVFLFRKAVSLGDVTDDFEVTRLSYTFPRDIYYSNLPVYEDGKTISITKEEFDEKGKLYAIFNEACYLKEEITYAGVSDGLMTTENCFLHIDTDNVIDHVEITKNGNVFKNKYSYKVDGISYNSVYQNYPFSSSGNYVVTTTLANGKTSSVQFIIDRVVPYVNVNREMYDYNKSVVFSDSLSGIATATLNGEDIESGTVITASGNYELRLTDRVGNVTTKNFTLDNVNPTTNIDRTYYNKNKTITFDDDFTGIAQATVNGKKITSGTKLKTSGKYKLIVTDVAGNKKTASFVIDKVKPVTSIGSTFYKKNKTVTFSDKHSGVKKATLNGKKISSGKVVSTSGTYKLVVTDKAGNQRIRSFVVDKVKPITNMKALTYKTNKTITFSDKHSGVKKATLNGKKISSGKVVSKNGTYKLVIIDKAGNQKTVQFKIKK